MGEGEGETSVRLRIVHLLYRFVFSAVQFFSVHQWLSVSNISFKLQSFTGYTEIAFVPLRPDLERVTISFPLHDAANIDNLNVVFDNRYDAEFKIEGVAEQEPEPAASTEKRDVDSFYKKIFGISENRETNAVGKGLCLVISFPDAIKQDARDQKLLKLGISYEVLKPGLSLKFSPYSEDDQTCHIYSIRTDHAASWFPCFDPYSQPCTWKIEITTSAAYTAVASGELLEVAVNAEEDTKTFYYALNVPTSARNIGFAVGPFEKYVNPEMPEAMHYVLCDLYPLLKTTTASLDKAFEFFEELLSVRYPYPSYHQVFLDIPDGHSESFAALSLISIYSLFHDRIIDQVPLTRVQMSHCLGKQFFGCYVAPAAWSEVWLLNGIADYITGLFIQRQFGNSEYLFHLKKVIDSLVAFEAKWGLVCLKGSKEEKGTRTFCSLYPRLCSSLYKKALADKGHLVIRLLEKKISRESLSHVLCQFINLTTNSSKQKLAPLAWTNVLLTLDTFVRSISSVTGQDLTTFLNQWVYTGGHANFEISYTFNRKRNLIEFQMKQNVSKGVLKYVGPLAVAIQELDGYFTTILQIDDVNSQHEVSCHSKLKRQKKKKIPLSTGEEVDLDLSATDQENPLLWIRFDPERNVIGKINLHQPDSQWISALKYERDVLAQLEAIEHLCTVPTAQAKQVLIEAVEKDCFYYRVRAEAALAWGKISSKQTSGWVRGIPTLETTFQKLYGCVSVPRLVRPNDFSNFRNYFLLKAIIEALSLIKTPSGSCPPEVQSFLLNLLRLNVNTSNKYSDDSYRATIVKALSNTVNTSLLSATYTDATGATDGRKKVVEITKVIAGLLSMEKVNVSYKGEITMSSLMAIAELMKSGCVDSNPAFFLSYTKQGVLWDVRCLAFDCLAELIEAKRDLDLLLILLDLAEQDPDPFIRRVYEDNHRLQALASDLYFLFYGTKTPRVYEKADGTSRSKRRVNPLDETFTKESSNTAATPVIKLTKLDVLENGTLVMPASPSALSISSSDSNN